MFHVSFDKGGWVEQGAGTGSTGCGYGNRSSCRQIGKQIFRISDVIYQRSETFFFEFACHLDGGGFYTKLLLQTFFCFFFFFEKRRQMRHLFHNECTTANTRTVSKVNNFLFGLRILHSIFPRRVKFLFSFFFSDISERNNDYSDTLDFRRG